jgi:hypothetical protein
VKIKRNGTKAKPQAVGGRSLPHTAIKTRPGASWREIRKSKIDNSGQYDSMAQMAAATRIPISVLKTAKREGCRFVQHGRCELAVFCEWFFSRTGDSVDWTARSKRGEALLRELRLEIERKETVPFSTVTQFVSDLVGNVFFGELQRLQSEAPANLKGKNEVQIHEWAVEQTEKIKAALGSKLDEWQKKKETT